MMLWCSGVCCCWWPVEVVPTALPTGQVVGTLLGLVSVPSDAQPHCLTTQPSSGQVCAAQPMLIQAEVMGPF